VPAAIFQADSQWTEAAGLTWVGPNGEGGIPLDPARPMIGLLVRRDAPDADALSGVSIAIETSGYDVELHYDTVAAAPSAGAKSAVVPFAGDLAESMNDHWQLIAIDPVGDVQMLFGDERSLTGDPSVGRVHGVTVLGRHFSVAHIYLWERLPEKIYTASLGEWSLARRYENDEAGLTTGALPFYEQRHHHLHRNGRLDVVGYSPHDTLAQSSRMQQFGPYGELVAEGTISPDGEAVIDTANLAAQSGTARSRMLALGLTSKQFDPESKLYYFGYRWYSPELMRWTRKEPLGLDGPNLWQFVGGNPIANIDPNGLDRYALILTQNPEEYEAWRKALINRPWGPTLDHIFWVRDFDQMDRLLKGLSFRDPHVQRLDFVVHASPGQLAILEGDDWLEFFGDNFSPIPPGGGIGRETDVRFYACKLARDIEGTLPDDWIATTGPKFSKYFNLASILANSGLVFEDLLGVGTWRRFQAPQNPGSPPLQGKEAYQDDLLWRQW